MIFARLIEPGRVREGFDVWQSYSPFDELAAGFQLHTFSLERPEASVLEQNLQDSSANLRFAERGDRRPDHEKQARRARRP